MIGKTISHYKIIEKLGGGGMGVVYKAQDLKLDRYVALKFLPPELSRDEESKERFIHEAKAASALDHLNICTVYEIGETEDLSDVAGEQLFIAMAYYEGETLKKKIEKGLLDSNEAVEIAIQIAEGLEKAHKKGIVHRDIKPANIFITTDGIVKTLDFGLAKSSAQTQLTKMGSTIGTVAYMSPEQTKGEAVDHRTDIWSLGVVLYEMLTGQLPFKGDYEQAVIYSILNEEPKSLPSLWPEIPQNLGKLIKKMLNKDKEKRHQSLEEVILELQTRIQKKTSLYKERRKLIKIVIPIFSVLIIITIIGLVYFYILQKPDISLIKSIAVLPFVDMSPQKDQEYFCDGMTEELLNRLSNIKELRVPARTSVFTFKGKTENISEIGKKLSVKTVLEGSIRKSGDKLRVTAQLINVDDGYHLWSQTFDREMKDVFAIQDEISLAIVGALKAKLFSSEKARLEKKHTENTEAYQLYLKGRFYWNKRTLTDHQKAIDYYKLSIACDTNFALPYAGIADAYNLFFTRRSFEIAKKHARKALELDSLMSEALTSLAFATERNDWDFEKAEYYYKKAIELNPRYSTAYQWYGIFLTFMGRFDEGIKVIKKALELDPISLQINADYGGLSLFCSGRIEESINSLRKTLELDSTFLLAHRFLGKAYEGSGLFKEAVKEYLKGLEDNEDTMNFKRKMINAYNRDGWKGFVKANLLHALNDFNNEYFDNTSYVTFRIALGYCRMRDRDKTIEWLWNMYELKGVGFIQIKTDIRFDWLKEDSEYKEILSKVFK